MGNSSMCESPQVNMGGIQEVPVLSRLKAKKQNLEQQLSDLDNAIKQLESHPDVYEVLEALNKVGNRY